MGFRKHAAVKALTIVTTLVSALGFWAVIQSTAPQDTSASTGASTTTPAARSATTTRTNRAAVPATNSQAVRRTTTRTHVS